MPSRQLQFGPMGGLVSCRGLDNFNRVLGHVILDTQQSKSKQVLRLGLWSLGLRGLGWVQGRV